MKAYLILTAVGPDRPGLVDEVSAYLADKDLNIESSRMAVLGGEFALILLASGEEPGIEQLAVKPEGLAEASGLAIFARKTDPPESRVTPASLPYSIVASGMDHPGIVQQVSRVLHRFQVNIESMDTRVAPAPVSGTPIFTMEAVVSVPASIKIREIKKKLFELGDSLNMDIEFEPVESG